MQKQQHAATAGQATSRVIAANFDALPDSAFIRESQLVQSPKRPDSPAPLPFSAPTLWRKVKAGTRAHTRKTKTAPDELLEGPDHGSTNMDDRTTPAPARGHHAVEALEPIHRPHKPRRKSGGSA